MSCKQIDAMCLQETEIEYQFDTNLLAIDGYQLELESNDIKARTPSNHISFEALHKLSKRATPEQMMRYKLSLCLYKLYNVPSSRGGLVAERWSDNRLDSITVDRIPSPMVY